MEYNQWSEIESIDWNTALGFDIAFGALVVIVLSIRTADATLEVDDKVDEIFAVA